MKLAHMTVVTPGKCGLYETARELVTNLRQQGTASRLVDPTRDKNGLHPDGPADRGAVFGDMDWALKADVIVNHSGYDNTPIGKTDQPVILVLHGRPRSSFLSEVKGSTPIYSYNYHKNKDPRVKAVVTFWPEHLPYLEVLFPDKPVFHVPACVDLNAWTPDGPTTYDFHGKRGKINAVCTDPFRDDIDPFVPLNAFALWAREVKHAKLHIYAKPKDKKGWPVLLRRLSDDGYLGEVCGWTTGLEHIYRAADFVMTANTIDTRTVREAMACGCPVLRLPEINGYRTDFAAAMLHDRAQVRAEAERRFDPARTAREFKAVLEAIR